MFEVFEMSADVHYLCEKSSEDGVLHMVANFIGEDGKKRAVEARDALNRGRQG